MGSKAFDIEPGYFQRVPGTTLGWPFWDPSSKPWVLEIKKSRVMGAISHPVPWTKLNPPSHSHQFQCSSLLVLFLLLPLLLLLIMINNTIRRTRWCWGASLRCLDIFHFWRMHLAFIVRINPIVNAEIFPSVFGTMLYRHKKTSMGINLIEGMRCGRSMFCFN